MIKKYISLGPDGKLVFKSSDGQAESINNINNYYAYLLLDCSYSMAESNKLSQAKNGAKNFVKEAIKKGYQIGLIKFASDADHICGPQTDHSVLFKLINTINGVGSTNMTDAIKMAFEKLRKRKGILYMIIVTDGMPDEPSRALKFAKEAKRNGIKIIAIGTDDAKKKFLNNLASKDHFSVKVHRSKLEQSISSSVKLLTK